MTTTNFSSRVLGRSACVFGCAIVVLHVDVVGAAPRVRGDEIARGHRAAAGEALVRMRPGVSSQVTLADPLADIESEDAVGRGAWRLVRSRTRSADLLARILAARTDVEAAEPNFAVHLLGIPNDFAAPLWALQNTGQLLPNGDTGTPGVDIDAPHAWDVTQGSRRIVVATVDTGIAQGHRDLAANLWTAPHSFTVTLSGIALTCPAGSHGFNAIAHSCDPADDNGHGTHVAGSIGAVGNNSNGVVGVNWSTSIMALKFMDATGNGYISDAINAIEFAIQAKQVFAAAGDADVRVLNNSWSGGGFSQALNDEISRANSAGMLFVAAAGNTGLNHDTTPAYPSDYSGANVLSVAATDYRDRLGAFSDFGAQHVQLGAPGSVIYSTGWTAADPTGSYETRSGTSMAAAYTSGVAALVLSHCAYAPGALRDALLRTTVPVPALAGLTASGGRVNAAAAVHSCDAAAGNADEVVHAADVPAADRHGAWVRQPDPTAADGVRLGTADAGWATTSTPLAQPKDYVDLHVPVVAGVPYRVWVRLTAAGNSKWNDSVWLQFSDARVNGASVFGINTDTGVAVNLENCFNCGVAGWGWQDGAYWVADAPVTFGSSGVQTIRIQTREDGVAFDQLVVSSRLWLNSPPGQTSGDSTIVPGTATGGTSGTGTGGSIASTPFTGTPYAAPGVIQAENFDNGGEGIAFHDSDPGNNGGAYRGDAVDIEPTAGGGQNVGWIVPGEWLAYTIDVASAGTYAAQFRVAALGPGGTFHVDLNGTNVSGALLIPDTGGWQNWRLIPASVTLPAGRQQIRLVMDTSGAYAVGNIDWFAFITGASASALPGRVAAVDFDAGGEGVGYHDDSAGNTGGGYRSSDVDIEACAEGGYNVGWIDAGEWLRYTVDVASPGNYTLSLRVASPAGGATLHVNAGGMNISGPIAVPATGAWQAWTTVSVPVTLSAARQVLTLAFDTPGFNVRYLELTAR